MIRMFCRPDESELGKYTLAVVEALHSLDVAVRLVPWTGLDLRQPVGTEKSRWQDFVDMFLTRLEGAWSNVVATPPTEWRRLLTANVRNVLVTTELPPPNTNLSGWACVVVPSADLGWKWAEVDVTPVVFPVAWSPTQAVLLRTALLPSPEPQELDEE